jgi:hypothetical protein
VPNSALFAAALVAFAMPVLAQKPALAMLDRLESGSWELRLREPGGDVQRVCLRDGRGLIQLRHQGDACERLIINDGANEVTVQYTCRGQGFGRTHIRLETARLAQIETQGIADGLPFAYNMEARRIGDCAR